MIQFYAYIYSDPSRLDNKGYPEKFYIGKGKAKRAWKHLKRTGKHPFVQRLQYMKENGVSPLIEIINALDEVHAFFLEICLIDIIGRKDLGKGPLLNLTDGGEGPAGKIHSDELKKQWSLAKKGIPKSEETKRKLSEAHKGKIHGPVSEETKKKMSNAKKGIPKSDETRQNMSKAQKGKIITEEQREKISSSLKGNIPWNKGKKGSQVPWNKGKTGIYSEETLKKISDSLKGNIPWNKK